MLLFCLVNINSGEFNTYKHLHRAILVSQFTTDLVYCSFLDIIITFNHYSTQRIEKSYKMDVEAFFCAVFLPECNRKLVVKNSWIKIPITEEISNFGIKRSCLYKVFFSSIKTREPDFGANVLNVFDETRDACYNGNVLRSFSK